MTASRGVGSVLPTVSSRRDRPASVAPGRGTGSRLHFLDALRGLAAISVVVAHFVPNLPRTGLDGRIVTACDLLDPGKFGVVLFFLISGYIIPDSLGPSDDRIGRFAINRFFRLYPLYWLVLAVSVVLFATAGSPASPGDVLVNTTMVQGFLGRPNIIGAAWTLQIELSFGVLRAMLARARRLASPHVCFGAGLAALTLALAVARNLLVRKLPVALPLAISLMVFGTVWRQATLDRLPVARRLAAWQLVMTSLAIVPISIIGYNHDFGFHERWQPYLISYLLAIATFVACTTRVRIHLRAALFLGEISDSIYLTHSCVYWCAAHIGLGPDSVGGRPTLYLGLVGAAVVPISWLTFRLVERPFHRMGHRIAAGRTANGRGVVRPHSA